MQCWTPALFLPISLQRHPGSLHNIFQSFIKKVFDCMKGLMKKSINRLGIAYWVINKTLKEPFQMWLYVVCPHWVKAIYLCFFLTPAISPSTLLGLQIKEGSLWTKQRVWQSFGHLQRTKPFCMCGFDKIRAIWGWDRPFGYGRDEEGQGEISDHAHMSWSSFKPLNAYKILLELHGYYKKNIISLYFFCWVIKKKSRQRSLHRVLGWQ